MAFLGHIDTPIAMRPLRDLSRLTSLEVNLGHCAEESFVELQKVAHSCISLKDLSMNIVPSTFGQEDEFEQLKWIHTDQQPLKLRSLKLGGFNYKPQLTLNPAIRSLDEITEASMLTYLSISNSFTLPHIGSGNLTELSINMNDFHVSDTIEQAYLKALLGNCTHLERLELTNTSIFHVQPMCRLDVGNFGTRLTSLRLHHFEDAEGPCRRPVLNNEMIARLAEECPRISHLGIDLSYSGEWVSLLTSYIMRE